MVFDLETLAIDGAAALAEPVSAPANYKNPEAIADYIKKAEQEQLDKAALYPWTARIIALGTIDSSNVETVYLCDTEQKEGMALEAFWRQASFGPQVQHLRQLIGFNILGFDIPVLMARSRLLGVVYPKIDLTPWKCPHVDLMRELTFGANIKARSLHWYAKRFGITVDDTVTGADIAKLVADGNWDAVRAHCLSDCRITRQLAQHLGVLAKEAA